MVKINMLFETLLTLFWISLQTLTIGIEQDSGNNWYLNIKGINLPVLSSRKYNAFKQK